MCLCVVICVIAGQGWMSWVYFGYVPVCGNLCDGGSGVDDMVYLSVKWKGEHVPVCGDLCDSGSGLDDMGLPVSQMEGGACACV